ncbi:MAG: DNA-directed RNA polymerase subunit omega [Bacillota bacterium]|nr:MAG: DNA-directed RNA polymerase subunit omega [Planctomycetota bacterium]RUA11475.1 MAG: DNA-directed RNA polymerase subunit omega [Bacillota bacterium]
MLDVDIEDQLVEKTGGKLQLTSLMQKRLVELKRGARPLVVTDSLDLLDIVVQEILQGKVELGELEVTEANFLDDARKLKDGDSDEEKGVYGSDLKKVKEERIKELSEFLNPTKE